MKILFDLRTFVNSLTQIFLGLEPHYYERIDPKNIDSILKGRYILQTILSNSKKIISVFFLSEVKISIPWKVTDFLLAP